MVFTDDEVIAQITRSIGDVEPVNGDPVGSAPTTGVLFVNLPELWDKYAPKDLIAPGLREAYTRRDGVRLVMAVLIQKRFDVADNLSGLSVRLNQVYQHYEAMYTCAKEEIAALELAASRLGHPASQKMPTTLPRPPADRNQWWINWENRRRGLA